MTWNEYVATLTQQEQIRLIVALGAALTEVRQASEVATSNGLVEEARRHVATAIAQLEDARRLLGA